MEQNVNDKDNHKLYNEPLINFFKRFFFLMWNIFKVFIEFATILFWFMFWYFGHKACGILAPQPGIEPTPSALEGEVFNHWTTREVPINFKL